MVGLDVKASDVYASDTGLIYSAMFVIEGDFGLGLCGVGSTLACYLTIYASSNRDTRSESWAMPLRDKYSSDQNLL